MTSFVPVWVMDDTLTLRYWLYAYQRICDLEKHQPHGWWLEDYRFGFWKGSLGAPAFVYDEDKRLYLVSCEGMPRYAVR